MKEKLLAVLKPLVASKGLSKEEVEGLADIAVKNLTETSTDEEIKNVADGLVSYADLIQKAGNRMVTAVEKKYEGWIDPKKNPEPPKPNPKQEPNPNDPPKSLTQEEIQALIQKGIEDGLKPMREKEEQARLSKILMSHEKVAKMPDFFKKNYKLEKEEDLEATVTQMEADYAAAKAEMIKSGEFAEPPQGGNGGGDTDDLIKLMEEAAKTTAQ